MQILWLTQGWPEPNATAAGHRTSQLISALIESGANVTVCSSSPADKCPENVLGDEVTKKQFLPNDRLFDEFICELKPEITFFDRFSTEEQFSFRVREHLPECLRVLDTIDLHFLRVYREKVVEDCSEVSPLELTGYELSPIAVRELSSILRSDLSLLVSAAEERILTNHFRIPQEILRVVPPWYSVTGGKRFEDRTDFIFVGTGKHKPNVDAIKMLKRFLWPEIRNKTHTQTGAAVSCNIYGSYFGREVTELHDESLGFMIRGRCANIVTAMGEQRVNLAPLRFGAGIKGKIADGWSAGTPCVTTSIGSEGMTYNSLFGGFICNNWEDYIESAVRLYLDKSEWGRAHDNGKLILEKTFNKEANISSFRNVIMDAIEDTMQLRNSNWLGQMLWANQFRSTEYFSRWIELKNSKS